jgi:4-amino-4-deoxy-L-arabinose transferase-like glycosyltransferase
LPRWLALVLILVGLAFLTPLSRFLLAPSLLLLLVASAQLLRSSAQARTTGG